VVAVAHGLDRVDPSHPSVIHLLVAACVAVGGVSADEVSCQWSNGSRQKVPTAL
jgi:hypothetical protein